MIKSFTTLFALGSAFVVLPSCGLRVSFLPDGPLGAPKPENIKLTREEPLIYRPDKDKGFYAGTATKPVVPLPPEYGGSIPWEYTGEDIMKLPTEEQTIVSEAAQMPGGKQQTPQTSPPPLPPGFSRMNFPLPPWLIQLINTATGIADFTSKLGISGAPEVLSSVNEGKQIFQTAREIAVLNTRLMSGGRPADAALARLKTLASRPLAKDLMKALGTTMMCSLLMQKDITPDRQRWLCGSMLTRATDLPVAVDLADTNSGGFAHVNVILPRPSRIHRTDKIIEQLNKGIDPADTLYGGLGIEGRTDTP